MDGQTHELVDILWRWFVIRGPGRAMVNLPTKFEVSTANYSPAHVTQWIMHSGAMCSGASPRYLAATKLSPWAIIQGCFCDSKFSHFGRILACDRQIDRHTMTSYTMLT